MKVILKEDITSVGKMGELVNVSAGYARNYLIPMDKAVQATERNVSMLNHQKRVVESTIRKSRNAAETLAKQIESTSCTVIRSAGENDKLFGSVTKMDIVEELKKSGVSVDRKQVDLEHPIKALGIYTVPIRLQASVEAKLKLWVIKDKNKEG